MTHSDKAEQKRIYAREYARRRRASDPLFLEKQREAARKSQAKRRKEKTDTTALWREKNKEKISEYNKVYGKIHNKKLYKKANERAKIRRKTDPTFVLMCRERNRVYEALKGKRKSAKTETLLGCSYDFFRGYIEGKFVTNMGWHNMGEWHIDHIKPLCSFDLNDAEQQKQAFHYTNQQPLWAIDNLKKGAKYG